MMANRGAGERYFVVGVSHHAAPIPVRELWALDTESKRKVVRRLHEETGCQVLALSTCNRTEFYFCGTAEPALREVVAALAAVKERSCEGGSDLCYRWADAPAIDHLFRVASGLDSQILGETEIQGQVRLDLGLAREAGTCGRELGRLFDFALKVGKRVRRETGVSEGVLSAGQAGVLLASKILGDLSDSRVLLVGTGKIGRLTARALVGLGVGRLTVTSRTVENARRLADEFEGEVVPFEAVREAIAESDVVISSTASPVPLFDAGSLTPLVRRRSDRSLVIIDLAIPRDFNPDVSSLENVFLHDLDDLEAVLSQSRRQRLGALPRCEEIIRHEAGKFLAQQRYRLEIEPLVSRMIAAVDSWRREELEKEAGEIASDAKMLIESVTRKLIRRMLFVPVNRLKQLRNRGDLSDEVMAAIKTIFEVQGDENASRGNPGQ